MRGVVFTFVYYTLSVIYVLASLPFLALPGRGPVRGIIRSYTRAMNLNLRFVAGIRKEVRGRHNLPEGPFILAAKHQSWGDGFLVYPEVRNLAIVTGDHLEKFPLSPNLLSGPTTISKICLTSSIVYSLFKKGSISSGLSFIKFDK